MMRASCPELKMKLMPFICNPPLKIAEEGKNGPVSAKISISFPNFGSISLSTKIDDALFALMKEKLSSTNYTVVCIEG